MTDAMRPSSPPGDGSEVHDSGPPASRPRPDAPTAVLSRDRAQTGSDQQRDAPAPAFLNRVRSAPARVIRTGSGRERLSAPVAIAAVCPFLSGPDGAFRPSSPSRDHRCGAVDPPARLAVEQQQQLCLRTRHFECPAFVAATAPGVALTSSRPVPRSAPLVLDRAEPVVALAGLNVPARVLQFGLAGLLVVALAIVVLGGSGDGRLPGGVAGPTASSRSSAVARASAAPARTTAPRASAAAAVPTANGSATTAEPPPATDPAGSSEPDPTTDGTPAGSATRPGSTASPTGSVASGRTYKVRKGDTLSEIARRFGTTVKALQDLNKIKDPRLLRVGQVLKLP